MSSADDKDQQPKTAKENTPANFAGIAVEETKVEKGWKHSSPLISCRFDPTGRFVFAGAQDSTIQRWDLASGQKAAFAGHESWVRGMAFHPDGTTLLSGGFEGRLIWWPAAAEKPAPERIVAAHDGWIRAVAVSPDGEVVATAGNDLVVRLWSFADGSRLAQLDGHQNHVYSLAFHPDGQSLVSADLKGVVTTWDLAAGTARETLDASALYKYDKGFRADIGGARSMAFSRDGKSLALSGITNVTNAFAGVGNPLVIVFDWEKRAEKDVKPAQHHSKDKLKGVAWGVALHPHGFVIGASGGGGGGFLLFWKPGEKHEFFKLKLPDTARDLHLHPDELRLATAHFDGHVRISRMGGKAKAPEASATGS